MIITRKSDYSEHNTLNMLTGKSIIANDREVEKTQGEKL